jgi:flagellar protein FlbD
MIHVTRINQQQLVLNSDLIEHIEATPDTVITMTNGQKLVVVDSAEVVIEKIVAFRRSIYQPPFILSSTKDSSVTDGTEQ